MSRAIALLLLLSLPLSGKAAAEEAPPIGLSETRALVDAHRGTLWVDAVGRPDPRIGRWDARRSAARRAAEGRARALLHQHVDERLAAARADAERAAAVHRAIHEGATRVAVRPLVDGGAVVRVEVSLEALESATAGLEVSW